MCQAMLRLERSRRGSSLVSVATPCRAGVPARVDSKPRRQLAEGYAVRHATYPATLNGISRTLWRPVCIGAESKSRFGDAIMFQLAIFVRKDMALRDDLPPRYFRMDVAKRLRHIPGRLADDLDVPFNGATEQSVTGVVVEVLADHKFPNHTRSVPKTKKAVEGDPRPKCKGLVETTCRTHFVCSPVFRRPLNYPY
jgi:hypothetical protein